MKLCKIAMLIFIILLFSPSKVFANGVLFKDDFAQNSLNNWRVERNQQWDDLNQPCKNLGTSSNWQILNGKLAFAIDGPNCISTIVPQFLNLENINSYQFDFDLTMSETAFADRGFVFNWKNPQNWYGIKFFDQIVIIDKSIDDQYQVMGNSFRYPLFPNATYHFTIVVKNKTDFELKINNSPAFEASDPAHKMTGFMTVGLEASNGTVPRSVSFFDNVVVTSLDPGINLDVPLIKQTDSQWQSEEYDSAKKWAQNIGIGRWGCSLTSMVMILRYYGINFLPEGTYITPSSLNIWLKSQKDGYVGEGNLNWLAVTRLTQLINARYKTPKLEFKRLKGDIGLAQEQIKLQRPVILKIDGHFIVGDGVTEDEQDLLVKDPAFSRLKFADYSTPLLSVESFTPSFTDLSYFLMAHSEGLQVRLLNEKGDEITEFQGESENIKEFDPSKNISNLQEVRTVQHLMAKPAAGIYVLEVRAQNPGFYPFQFFSYDQQGKTTDLAETSYFGQEAKYYLITYNKEADSTIQSVPSFTNFRQDLEIGRSLGQIHPEQVGDILDKEASFAEFSGHTRQIRYLKMLDTLTDYYANNLANGLFITLKNDLSELSNQLNVIISR